MLNSLLEIAEAAMALRAAGVTQISYDGPGGKVSLELTPRLADVSDADTELAEPSEELEAAMDLCAAVTAEEDNAA